MPGQLEAIRENDEFETVSETTNNNSAIKAGAFDSILGGKSEVRDSKDKERYTIKLDGLEKS